MSNYNYGLEPGIEKQGSSKLRFVLIFLVISALTAAVLWWFWPDEGKSVPEKEKVTAEGSANPDKGGAGAPAKKEAPSLKPSDGKSGAADAASTSSPPVKKESEDKKNPSPSGNDSPTQGKTVGDPTDPPLPDKGIITPADQKGADLPVVPVDGVISEEQKKALEKAQDLLAKKKYSEAAKCAEKALEGVTENSSFYRKAWRVLSSARVGIAFYEAAAPYVVRYRIRGGDSLSGVAGKYFTTVEFLRKRNNISGSRIFVGRQLYVVPGDWKIIVSKKYRLLKLYRKQEKTEKLFAVWEIGIGRMGKTPTADFAISSRVKHPDWYLPDGRVFKYGEAENQLGEYFLKLAPLSAPGRPLQGYGIHGAKDETTVGRSLSSGCVRMRNADVEALYYLVPVGTHVSIVEQ